MSAQPTEAGYLAAIAAALEAGEMRDVVGLLQLMAVRYPDGAQSVCDLIDVAARLGAEPTS